MKHGVLVGFTTSGPAGLPGFFCAGFKHVAVVIDRMFVQIGTDGIRMFKCGPREIRKLEAAGWTFIEVNGAAGGTGLFIPQFLTCVGFAKRALGIHAPFVWTPDQLFRYLARA